LGSVNGKIELCKCAAKMLLKGETSDASNKKCGEKQQKQQQRGGDVFITFENFSKRS
jgi:hypothetical protein